MDVIKQLDIAFFTFVNSNGTTFWDPFFLFITHKLSWIPLYLFLIFLLFKETKNRIFIPLLSIILLIVVCDQGSVHLFKNVFERLRPCHFLENVRLVTEGCGGLYGFVSSHASNVFGLAIFIGGILGKKVFYSLFFWASLVSFSRIYVGVHYPLDIFFGMLWGSCVALLFLIFYQKIDDAI